MFKVVGDAGIYTIIDIYIYLFKALQISENFIVMITVPDLTGSTSKAIHSLRFCFEGKSLNMQKSLRVRLKVNSQYETFGRIRTLDNFQRPNPQPGHRLLELRPGIAAVGKHMAQPREG